MQAFSTQSLTIVGTLVAALITGGVAFVNMTLSKELKTSEFRQAWIDGLRDDLAKFFGAARAFARAVEAVQLYGAEYKEKVVLPISDAKVGELRYQAAEMMSKINLRLNPEEAKHQELSCRLRQAIDVQNHILSNGGPVDQALDAVDRASDCARSILKEEWTRVKNGEPVFRFARDLVAPTVFLTSIGLLVLLWYGATKH